MSSGDSPVSYLSWTQPGTSIKVEYSLPLFHEIDFFVNEGYRRIPHGGIELGGLLFGRATSDGIRVEAFRPIECEHAFGPSFKLSDQDVARLRTQIEAGAGEADLAGLQVAGWFIAHTRSELQMNEAEAALFDDLMAGPWKITVLVKPEKFKATRFAVLLRGADGSVERDGVERSFVLPLPGRASRAETVVSPAAPPGAAERPAARRRPLSELVQTVPEPVAPEPIAPEPIAPEPIAPPPPPVEEESSPTSVRVDRRRVERRQLARGVRIQTSGSKLRSASLLFLAGLLGCGVGFWAYSRLPAAVIPLHMQPGPDGLVVSWPAEATRDADDVALRIDDGQPMAVPATDRFTGRSEIVAFGDSVKVELIVRRWIRDSRGIVRFVGPVNAPAPRETTGKP